MSQEIALDTLDRIGSLRLWNKYMSAYDFLTRVDSYSENIREIAQTIHARPGLRLLDAGSGTGNLSMLLRAERVDVVSLDFSGEALRVHRQKDPEAVQVQTSLEEPLPFEASTFDVVCCASVLFALSQKGCRTALREFNRVLTPGGRLVVTVACPSKRNSSLLKRHLRSKFASGYWHGLVRLVREAPSLIRVLHYNRLLQRQPDWKGYHRFSENELHQTIDAAGFSNIEIARTYGGSFFLVQALKPKK